jgi:hypothetical protein
MPLRKRTALEIFRDRRQALTLYRVRAGTVADEQTVVRESVNELELPSVGVKLRLASYVQEATDAGAHRLVGAKRAKAAPTRRRA